MTNPRWILCPSQTRAIFFLSLNFLHSCFKLCYFLWCFFCLGWVILYLLATFHLNFSKFFPWKQFRSSHRRCSIRKGVLRNSQNSQENTYSTKSLFFNKVKRCFPVNFAKFQRTSFLQNISEWLLLAVFNFSRTSYEAAFFNAFCSNAIIKLVTWPAKIDENKFVSLAFQFLVLFFSMATSFTLTTAQKIF